MQPFCIAAIGTILGIVTGLYLNSIAFLICIILLNILIIIKFKKKYVKNIFIYLIFFICFFIYIITLENKYEKIINIYGNKQIIIKGIVVSNGEKTEYKTKYKVKVITVYNNTTKQLKNENFNIICNIKDSKNETNLKYGDEIAFSCIFEIPDSQRNENGFNYRQYLKTQKIAGKVDIEKEDIKIIKDKQGSNIARIINSFRNNLLEKVYKILPNKEAGICVALLLGEKSGISNELEQSFREASLSHMLAISGAHITYILLGITLVLNFFNIHKRWSKIFICIFLLIFIFIAGGSPSITRACIMTILKLIADILFLKSNTYNNLAISAIIIFIFNPYAIFDVGLQLSYGGTIGIITFVDIFENISKNNSNIKILTYIKQTIIITISANIIIIPIMLYNFNTIYLSFIISNLLATPIMGICLIIGMFFLVFLIITPISYVISILLIPLLKIFIIIAEFSSKIPFPKILLPAPKVWQILIYYFIIYLCFFKNKIQKNSPNIVKNYKKIIILLIIIILIPYIISLIPPNKLIINFIDVGQGDCMLITTPSNKKILIDGGGSEFGSFNVGEQTLLPYLLNKYIFCIDYMLFTHFDTDHCQGLLTILENIKVKNVIIGKQGEQSSNFTEFLKIVSEKNINIIKVKSGDKICIDKNCELNILFPDTTLIKQNILNNNSIVAKFVYKKISILLTGDIEEIAEKKLIQKYKNTEMLNSTILKVAHHGSKSSSTQEFLNLVKPKIALIGVGAKNTFGHPSEIVLQRLESLGCKIYRTDLNGEIIL